MDWQWGVRPMHWLVTLDYIYLGLFASTTAKERRRDGHQNRILWYKLFTTYSDRLYQMSHTVWSHYSYHYGQVRATSGTCAPRKVSSRWQWNDITPADCSLMAAYYWANAASPQPTQHLSDISKLKFINLYGAVRQARMSAGPLCTTAWHQSDRMSYLAHGTDGQTDKSMQDPSVPLHS